MVRAQTEELRRIQRHADDERDKLHKEMEKQREHLQRERDQEKERFEKDRNRLRRDREEEKEAMHKEVEDIKQCMRKEKEEEVERLRKELDVERVRVRSQLDKSFEQVEAERASVQQKLEEEKRRLVEKAEEDRKRLKEQVRKAIEEVMRRHAAELHSLQEALSSEKKINQEVSPMGGWLRSLDGSSHSKICGFLFCLFLDPMTSSFGSFIPLIPKPEINNLTFLHPQLQSCEAKRLKVMHSIYIPSLSGCTINHLDSCSPHAFGEHFS